jgi:integrase
VTRVARLDPAAAAAIDSYIKDYRAPSASDHLFLTASGRPFSYAGFGNLFARIRDRLRKEGMPGFMSHRLRHTWATNGHRVGMSPFDLQQEGGWKDLEMVRRYTKNRPFEELERLPTPFTGLFGSTRRSVSARPNLSPISRIS